MFVATFCILLHHRLCIQENTCNFYIFIFTCFTFFFCPYLHLSLSIPSARLLTSFDNELAINLVLSINRKMYNICFVTFSPFLSIIASSYSFGTVKVMYFSVFSPKQINSFSNSFANSFMIK